MYPSDEIITPEPNLWFGLFGCDSIETIELEI